MTNIDGVKNIMKTKQIYFPDANILSFIIALQVFFHKFSLKFVKILQYAYLQTLIIKKYFHLHENNKHLY